MQKQIQVLQSIISQKSSRKMLTFSLPHIFKSIQILYSEKYVSRSEFTKKLFLGEGSVKTLISYLKKAKIVDTTKSGTFLLEKGKTLAKFLEENIPNECDIKKCKIARKKYNHVILLKNKSKVIKNGLEQRDYAILYGSEGCITLIYRNNRFVFPGDDKDALSEDIKTKQELLKKLEPEEDDVIIISSSDDPFVAEISAKNSALGTLVNS